jgi:hypothetical protein
MSYCQDSALSKLLTYSLLDEFVCFHINAGCCFIDAQYLLGVRKMNKLFSRVSRALIGLERFY